jgi:hypothetical protein
MYWMWNVSTYVQKFAIRDDMAVVLHPLLVRAPVLRFEDLTHVPKQWVAIRGTGQLLKHSVWEDVAVALVDDVQAIAGGEGEGSLREVGLELFGIEIEAR